MASNQLSEDRGEHLGDVSATTAILYRFIHLAEGITVKGRSYLHKTRTNDTRLRSVAAFAVSTVDVCMALFRHEFDVEA